jgi:hypothetical protein
VRRVTTVSTNAVAAAALLVAGCSAGGADGPDATTVEDVDPEQDATPEADPDDPDDDAPDDGPDDADDAPDDADDPAAEPEAGDLEVGDGDEGTGSDLEVGEADDVGSSDDEAAGDTDGADDGSGGRAVPEDLDLDVTVRHPGGTVVELSSVTFDGAEVRVDAEFINGADRDVRVTLSGGNRLRLMDDRGAEYNLVVPDDLRDRDLELTQGESISGEFVFIGPIDRDASSLVLVANSRASNPVAGDMEGARSSENAPTIVVDGLELTW